MKSFGKQYDFTYQDILDYTYDGVSLKMPESADTFEELEQILFIARLNVYRRYRSYYNQYTSKHKLYNRMFSGGLIGEKDFREKIRGIEVFSDFNLLKEEKDFEYFKRIDVDREYWRLRETNYMVDDNIFSPKFINLCTFKMPINKS